MMLEKLSATNKKSLPFEETLIQYVNTVVIIYPDVRSL